MFDRLSGRKLFLFWFLLTITGVGTMQLTQAKAMGGLAGLPGAGALHPVSQLVLQQLPDAPLQEGIGHDGQLFFAIALDPLGRTTPPYLEPVESPSYRYRRIAYPALAGLFGTIQGEALVVSLALVNLASAGLAAGATALIARTRGQSPWLAAAITLNPGVWLSARLLTADNLALAAGMVGILLVLRKAYRASILPLALAALTKEVAIVFAVGLAFHVWRTDGLRTALKILVGSATPLAVWLIYVHLSVGSMFDAAGNVTWPGVGIVDSIPLWPAQPGSDVAWTVIALVAFVGGLVGLPRMRPFWRSVLVPWLAIAATSSYLVWHVGNNAVRTLAAIIPLVGLGLADRMTISAATPSRTSPYTTRRSP